MKLGEYEIIERIASGGMAEVFRGRALGDEGFEKPVAIKRILPHFVQDTRFVSMLVQEARIHASLHHRNIVQIHDLGLSQDGEYFIVLEYVDGRDLGALLETLALAAPPGNRMSDALALYVAIELGEGISIAHQHAGPDGRRTGLVHRDISPSNVLLSYAGEVKLSDFGLAKRQSDHSVVGSLKGKLEYMSPEQARRSALDGRSDIFSLGAVLFEMLTGRRLRQIADEVEGWRQVASGEMASARHMRPDISPVLEALLAGALAPNPDHRFPDAAAFVAAARQALDRVPRAKLGEAAEMQSVLRRFLPPGAPRPHTEPSRVIRLVSEFLPGARRLMSPPPSRSPTAPPALVEAQMTSGGGPARHSTLQGMPMTHPGGSAKNDHSITIPGGPRAIGKQALANPKEAPSRPPPPPVAVATAHGGGHSTGTGNPRPNMGPPTPDDGLAPVAGELPIAPRVDRDSPIVRPPLVYIPDIATRDQPPRRLDAGRTGPPPLPSVNVPVAKVAPVVTPVAPALGSTGGADDKTPALALSALAGLARQPRTQGRGGRVVVMFALGLAGVVTALHYYFVPLPVLVRWTQPTKLRVTSTPSGTAVTLDGVRLQERTPLLLDVHRDRREHSVELHREGYQPVQQALRLDRDPIPSVDLVLVPALAPSSERLPAPVAREVDDLAEPVVSTVAAAVDPPRLKPSPEKRKANAKKRRGSRRARR